MEAKHKNLLLAALGVGVLLLVNTAGQVQDTIDGLTFKFGIGGAPSISGLSITFPVKVTVANPGTVTLPLQGLAMTLERMAADGTGSLIAATDPAGVITPSIAARASTDFIVPIHTDLVSAALVIASAISNRALGRYRLKSSIFSAGVRVPLPDQYLTY
jgi:hypothetical protein